MRSSGVPVIRRTRGVDDDVTDERMGSSDGIEEAVTTFGETVVDSGISGSDGSDDTVLISRWDSEDIVISAGALDDTVTASEVILSGNRDDSFTDASEDVGEDVELFSSRVVDDASEDTVTAGALVSGSEEVDDMVLDSKEPDCEVDVSTFSVDFRDVDETFEGSEELDAVTVLIYDTSEDKVVGLTVVSEDETASGADVDLTEEVLLVSDVLAGVVGASDDSVVDSVGLDGAAVRINDSEVVVSSVGVVVETVVETVVRSEDLSDKFPFSFGNVDGSGLDDDSLVDSDGSEDVTVLGDVVDLTSDFGEVVIGVLPCLKGVFEVIASISEAVINDTEDVGTTTVDVSMPAGS